MGIPDGEMKAQLDGDTKDGGDDAERVWGGGCRENGVL